VGVLPYAERMPFRLVQRLLSSVFEGGRVAAKSSVRWSSIDTASSLRATASPQSRLLERLGGEDGRDTYHEQAATAHQQQQEQQVAAGAESARSVLVSMFTPMLQGRLQLHSLALLEQLVSLYPPSAPADVTSLRRLYDAALSLESQEHWAAGERAGLHRRMLQLLDQAAERAGQDLQTRQHIANHLCAQIERREEERADPHTAALLGHKLAERVQQLRMEAEQQQGDSTTPPQLHQFSSLLERAQVLLEALELHAMEAEDAANISASSTSSTASDTPTTATMDSATKLFTAMTALRDAMDWLTSAQRQQQQLQEQQQQQQSSSDNNIDGNADSATVSAATHHDDSAATNEVPSPAGNDHGGVTSTARV